jgi:DNA-directed RNA polymerase subunit RPC12/RpoP
MDQLAWLVLKRPYLCIKCDRVQLGSVFLDFDWSRPRKSRHKTSRDKKESIEVNCPECGGIARRSRRRGLERLLFFSKAYRCSDCEARFRTFKAG